MKIGVVCEGSHDFIVLQGFLASALGVQESNVAAIQPQLDATMAQIGGGGYPRVKIWCLQNSGRRFYQNIGPGLFAGSQTFDHILIHLDGDVVEKSGWFSPVDIATANASISDRYRLVSEWIERTVAFEGGDELLTAIPVQSTDAWVLATIRPGRCFEHYEFKDRLSRYLKKFFGNNKAMALKTIIPHCASNLEFARQSNTSLDTFINLLPQP